MIPALRLRRRARVPRVTSPEPRARRSSAPRAPEDHRGGSRGPDPGDMNLSSLDTAPSEGLFSAVNVDVHSVLGPHLAAQINVLEDELCCARNANYLTETLCSFVFSSHCALFLCFTHVSSGTQTQAQSPTLLPLSHSPPSLPSSACFNAALPSFLPFPFPHRSLRPLPLPPSNSLSHPPSLPIPPLLPTLACLI